MKNIPFGIPELPRKTIEDFQILFKKLYGVDYTYEEAWEATYNLVGLFNLLLQLDRKQKRARQKKNADNS